MPATTIDTMENRIAELDDGLSFVFVHEDGSVTAVVYDMDPEHADPRDMDNLGIMLAPHRRYNLGDHEHPLVEEIVRYLDDGTRWSVIARWLRIFHGTTTIIPLGLIDHSGLSMYAGGGAHWCDPGGWDSGTVGFIFDTAETRERTGVAPENVEKGLLSEVSVYDSYLRGEVYGVIHLTPTGEVVETDVDGSTVLGLTYEEDSCWGFLGYDSPRDLAESEYGPVKGEV